MRRNFFILVGALIITVLLTAILIRAYDPQQKNASQEALESRLEAQRLIGRAYGAIAENDLASAERLLRHSLDMQPNNPAAYRMMGPIFYNTGRFTQAETIYRRLLEINPDDPAAHNNLGQVFVKMNRQQEAVEQFEKAIELAPGQPLPYLNLATVCSALNDRARAIGALQKARELLGDSLLPLADSALLDNIRQEKDFQQLFRPAAAATETGDTEKTP